MASADALVRLRDFWFFDLLGIAYFVIASVRAHNSSTAVCRLSASVEKTNPTIVLKITTEATITRYALRPFFGPPPGLEDQW